MKEEMKRKMAEKVIEEYIELFRLIVDEDGEVDEDIVEEWLEEWDDVEYRMDRKGRYRGVTLLQANYFDYGFDIEIDTTRYEIIARDTDTEEAIMARFVQDEEAIAGLHEIHTAWHEVWEEEVA